ncbi:MAG TPA: hypothetical protein VHT53_06335 [Candidatus Elarobacter sp.]|jgi:hypothetical protein|nr:hypothetical protein [Candidatus Elarobacter sp.]
MSTPADPATKSDARAYVLGGNASTLAFTSSLVPENRQVTAWLVPLAWTPIGVVLGENWQRVGVAADNVAGWTDQTFDPSDERSFVSSLRDLELLARVGWSAGVPDALTEDVVVNADDLPEDILDAMSHPAESLVQCAICRRTCVRDHFVWNERRLCAWDFHATVFGKRGPWRDAPYEDRLWETIPRAAYVAGPLLDDVAVDAVLAVDGLDDELAHRLINDAIASDAAHAHLAVRTTSGYTLLRERGHHGDGPGAEEDRD